MLLYCARNLFSRRRIAIKSSQPNYRNVEQFRALKNLFDAGVPCVRPLYLDPRHRFFSWIGLMPRALANSSEAGITAR
jgi:hypothetical protein